MAAPLNTGKQSVRLGAPGVPGSRIRRDPPAPVKELVVRERDERDTRTVVIGIITFAIAFTILALAIGSTIGWSPRHYVAHF
ncbi:MAG: hypothetical protein ABIN83_02440 [Sphingomicrobium sp.]